MLTGINLQSGVTYYSNVMAINHVGLMSIASSDSVMIDSNLPKTGIVYDGLGLEDNDYQNSTTVVSASWHGFSDLESSIDHYIWCVGRSPGAEDILPCHDVGLHLSKAETLDLPITSGERYFSKVMAVDAAGLVSLSAVSDGVILDTSAPVIRSMYFNDSNLIENPSFEEIQDTTEDGNSTDGCADGVSLSCKPKGWQIEGIGYVQTSAETVGQSENAYLILYGSVSQYIGTVEGDKYKLSFHVSHTVQSSTPLLSQEGYIDIPGMHRVFHLFQRAGSHGDNGLAEWFEHAYYFTADSASSNIEIGSFGERSAIALDNVRVQRLSPITDTDDVTEEFATAIAVDVRTDGIRFAVIANWDMIDIESAIIEYLWAIGTVKGGTQIQTFKSVGRLNHAIADDLVLTHGLPIYVTVVAKNAADLQTAIYSEPWLIDLTPPDLCCVMDGADEDVDAVYQITSTISVHWNVSDPESGVQYCEWAAGFSPGSEILMSFIRSESLSFAQGNFTNSLEHGQKVYCTVRCHNGAGLFTQQTSNGVVMIKDAPTSSEGTLHVVTSSPTIFGTRHNHQGDTDSIAIVWNGFMDVTGIAYYECKFVDGRNDTEWRSVGLNGENTALLTGLDLNTTRPLTYQIHLRAINHGGFISETLTANVTVKSSPPVLTGIAIQHTWLDDNTVLLSWSDVFYSQSLLIYELTVTTLHGGSTVVKWFETRETTYP
ncbi:uncharacterized protein [Ptychodera flava]|uniref:uncharacterized protein n=1 Tax=Ptychodera flava TaxID=63121 RepID=UPI003969C7ED